MPVQFSAIVMSIIHYTRKKPGIYYAVPPEEAYTWGGLLIFIKLGVLFNDDKFIMEITVN